MIRRNAITYTRARPPHGQKGLNMAKIILFPAQLDLQLFAEAAGAEGSGTAAQGAQGVTGAAALPQTKAAKNNPLANVKYGIQDEGQPAQTPPATETAGIDRNAEFEKLIKGEYKDLYDARVRDTVQKRLKSSKDAEAKIESLAPTLELLAKKYGVKADDIEALNAAIEEDDSYFEEEALERGVTVETLREIKKMERENAQLREQMKEQKNRENADKLYASWIQGEQETKSVYPQFSLKTEMQNTAFTDLLKAGIDVKTAFEVVHKDEIIPAAMQYTAKTVEQKVANSIRTNGARPAENGISSQSAATIKSDVSQLSKADRAEIIRRVQRGEKIRF